ncbi:methyl-accepting chemotaxis protein McpB [Clostridium homopropionicum DSM 5847]|uniref:Methyl-accepting chemotaxis protein McpB n=1 Tax=Clostridium homopropionicum DSM 5847 TaxID=1121318 RepID=A0A0L6Z8J5_9CLOT|nr:methyl-accepting chemotaxis protein [Clostridium homopropionicum]KOA19290.1 methyl-accepting chemotaxis protein McpB [Clostridium homopropionicum DSM 5847]SFG19980.1 methyl-accepting chemotaxis protein [Clostridium homopropionicum]
MKIKHKLLLTFGLIIILSFAIVGINFMTYKTMESDANFVNHAGKLRASSYKMAQLANVIVATKNNDAMNSLEESIKLFDEILKDVSDGNSEKGLSKLKHTDTEMKLTEIIKKWNSTYKDAYLAVLNTGDTVSLQMINSEVSGYVDSINDMVTGYSQYSSLKVSTAKMTNGILIIVVLFIGIIAFIFLNKGITNPINLLIEDMKDLSEGNGDLTKRIEINSKDEIADMIHYFNKFIVDIHEIVKEISKISSILLSNMNAITSTTGQLTKSTEMIAMSSMDVAEGSLLQNNKLDELNNLVEKMRMDIENVSQKAHQTLKSSEKSQESVLNGDRQVSVQSDELTKFVHSIKSASHTVEDLNQSSEEIKAIVDLIHSISSQTNLLALNASIEAARAGESGRGFAVVADEIRKLAEETSVSAKKISDIVMSISDKTMNVKTSMDELVDNTKVQEKSMETLKDELKEILNVTAVTLNESQEIMEISTKVNNEFSVMTHSAKDIQSVAVQNSGNTQDVASAVEEQTASFEEVSANISSINEMTEELTKIVGRFRI